jgi:hypothetical protein
MGQKLPFSTINPEACHVPLSAMASGGDDGRCPYSEVPTTIVASCRPIAQRWMPALVRHRRWPGESLLHAGARLGLPLCCDAGLCLLIHVGLYLLHMRWALSFKGSSLPRRGRQIAERVPSSRGSKYWQPLHACLGRCTQIVMLVTSTLMPSSKTSSHKHATLVLGINSPPTLAEC